MDPRLHKAAKEGNVQLLTEIIGGRNGPDLQFSLTPQKNTALHVAARFGCQEVAEEILHLCPSLLTQANSNGDMPLHKAASAGHLSLVQLFTGSYQPPILNTSNPESQTDTEHGPSNVSLDSSLLRVENLGKNTALHEALRNRHEEVALHLLERDPDLAHFVSKAGESPLYIAAERKMVRAIEKIVRGGPLSFSYQGPFGQTPLNAAVIARSFETVEVLVRRAAELIKVVDGSGRTALHYAASAGLTEIVHLLLQTDRGLASVLDNDGLSPLLVAVQFHHVPAVGVILEYCPDSSEQLDTSGRNALHIAVTNNAVLTLKLLLKSFGGFEELINEGDKDGNTPLHLAVRNNYSEIVELLIRIGGVDLAARNNEGIAALDISESRNERDFKQVYVRDLLLLKGATHGKHYYPENLPQNIDPLDDPKADLSPIVNTLLVVSTLIATITFAAAFTMPGGYNNDGPNQGVATMLRKAAFKVFVISDTGALCFSMISAFDLIWSMLVNSRDRLFAVTVSGLFLVYALLGTMVAFMMGVYVVIFDGCRWLAILVCIMGCAVPFFIFEFTFNQFKTPLPIAILLRAMVLRRQRQLISIERFLDEDTGHVSFVGSLMRFLTKPVIGSIMEGFI